MVTFNRVLEHVRAQRIALHSDLRATRAIFSDKRGVREREVGISSERRSQTERREEDTIETASNSRVHGGEQLEIPRRFLVRSGNPELENRSDNIGRAVALLLQRREFSEADGPVSDRGGRDQREGSRESRAIEPSDSGSADRRFLEHKVPLPLERDRGAEGQYRKDGHEASSASSLQHRRRVASADQFLQKHWDEKRRYLESHYEPHTGPFFFFLRLINSYRCWDLCLS